MEQKHVEYNGMVYDDIAVDLLCDLTKERTVVLDRRVKEHIGYVEELITKERKMLSQLYNQVDTMTECTAYGAPHVAQLNEEQINKSIEPCHQELIKSIMKLSALCEEREHLQNMLGRCSMTCAVADDEEDYDYGEDE